MPSYKTIMKKHTYTSVVGYWYILILIHRRAKSQKYISKKTQNLKKYKIIITIHPKKN